MILFIGWAAVILLCVWFVPAAGVAIYFYYNDGPGPHSVWHSLFGSCVLGALWPILVAILFIDVDELT